MRIVVRPSELEAESARLSARAVCLDALLVAARLEAAARAVAETRTSVAAEAAAARLRLAIARCRAQVAHSGEQLLAAADRYADADAAPSVRSAP